MIAWGEKLRFENGPALLSTWPPAIKTLPGTVSIRTPVRLHPAAREQGAAAQIYPGEYSVNRPLKGLPTEFRGERATYTQPETANRTIT